MTTNLSTLQVTDPQLQKYAKLIYAQTGIRISEQKKSLLSNRLRRRLRATGLSCFDDYYRLVEKLPQDDPEWSAFLQEITTHESFMYRDKGQWDWFRKEFIPNLAKEARQNNRPKSLRIWSAACSTGDEPYTIASCIADSLMDFKSWSIQIVATDIGSGALDHAKEGIFSERSVKELPENMRKRFFKKEQDANAWSAKPDIRSLIRFKQHNLLDPLVEKAFDLVVVKNVLIYFDKESKSKVLSQIEKVTKPGALLVSGPAEGISDLMKSWERLQGWLHRKPENAA